MMAIKKSKSGICKTLWRSIRQIKSTRCSEEIAISGQNGIILVFLPGQHELLQKSTELAQF